MSSLLKQRISSPLEAGTSILDSQNLPPHLTQALEYASKRLSRKALHITLVVIRKEYQIPSSTVPSATPTSAVSSSPASPGFGVASSGPLSPSRFTSPVAGLRQLVRRGTGSSIASTSSSVSEASSIRSAGASPTFSPPPSEGFSSPRRWPMTPCTPMTPHTPSSTTTSTSTSSSASSALGPNPFGIHLLYTHALDARAEKTLRHTIAKAERKFQTGTGFLPAAASTASAAGLSGDLVRRSLQQNEVLFSGEGLTLLGLDRLYTFKSALAAYARTTLPPGSLNSPVGEGERAARIEDAVDELRRLVLSRGGKLLERRELYRWYGWIGVSAGALGDVEKMYRRAYGGVDRIGAFEDYTPVASPVPAASSNETKASEKSDKKQDDWPLKETTVEAPRSISAGIIKIGTPPGSKGPALKLQTTFAKPVAQRPVIKEPVQKPLGEVMELEIKIEELEANEEDDDLTAKPALPGMSFWNGLGASIDGMMLNGHDHQQEVISPVIERISRTSRMGPVTPNGYDDISPVTRGEWGFLFSGDGWKRGKTAAVETC
ncbi:hypothetical protein JX265_002499 [Neoarthrinium moseri]|uniref:DUF7582 domain-containing protein n=1 Tax=Neoarthrinium moseri TaxID=1658444 RepID=A0A9P9WUJ2_9PEZI|nr:uncharacterized protein JN550_000313 [Neoarthrinium moseri]KAI1854860.1 hypothetical protein JX266_000978 [Neoarthrinium moseri]KAI1878131.1 hypothetical protein JN550_000313 [Neoarthrinium moseri]KAI1879545.1 hypothetical protein JX265_002499 [Neoarthrinium moseri]